MVGSHTGVRGSLAIIRRPVFIGNIVLAYKQSVGTYNTGIQAGIPIGKELVDAGAVCPVGVCAIKGSAVRHQIEINKLFCRY